MKNDKSLQNDVSNLRSQGALRRFCRQNYQLRLTSVTATTMLHEWLHFDWGSAVVCSQGCAYLPAQAMSGSHPCSRLFIGDDQQLMIAVPKAPQKVVAYKAGRAKLLAEIIVYGTPTRGAELASKNSECMWIR